MAGSMARQLNDKERHRTVATTVPGTGPEHNSEAQIEATGAHLHPDLWTPQELVEAIDALGADTVAEIRAALGPVEQYVPDVDELPNPFLEENPAA